MAYNYFEHWQHKEGLNEIFSTADALEGLSAMGRKRPEFKGA